MLGKTFYWVMLTRLSICALLIAGVVILIDHSIAQSSEATAYVEPPYCIYSTAEKKAGDTFQINYTVANVTGLAGVDFQLDWDPISLEGLSMVENLFSTVTPPGEEDNIWQLHHDVATDHVRYAYTYKDIDRAVAGGYCPINVTTSEYSEGKIAVATITLRIVTEPFPGDFIDCKINVTESRLGDLNASLISHTVNSGYYKLTAPSGPEEPMYGWPMFQHDCRHTGVSTAKAARTNHTRWMYDEGAHSSPVVADGMVVLHSLDGNVYAFDQKTGDFIWSHYVAASVTTSSPAIGDGLVFVGGGYSQNIVRALNQTTGNQVWSYPCAGDVYSSPTVVDGIVLIGSQMGGAYALNASNGYLIWNNGACGNVESSPAVANGKVYVGSSGTYCLNLYTGALVWNTLLGGWYSSPTVVEDLVFIGSSSGGVYAMNATTGELVWSYMTGDSVASSPAVSEGMVFIGSYDSKLYALNATTGSYIWSYEAERRVYSSPAVADGMVFAGSAGSEIFALNQTTGLLVWRYDTKGDTGMDIVEGSPAVAGGMVFMPSYGRLYAFGPMQDLAIVEVSCKRAIGHGYSTYVNVAVENQGENSESFNLTAYANATEIQTLTPTLSNGSSAVISFLWNTSDFVKGNYTLMAVAEVLPDETHPEDNTLVNDWAIITIPGDINADFTVDIYDAIMLANAYNSKPSDPNWNPNADVNCDNVVDIYDAIILATHFNEHYP